MPPVDDVSALEKMRERLYNPGTPIGFPAGTLHAPEVPVPPPLPEEQTPSTKKKLPGTVIFLIVAVLFFVAALASAAYLLVFGGRSVSTNRVDITIDGPTAIGSGDVVTLLLTVRNRNPVPITSTSLSIDFPETARSAEDTTQPLNHYADTVGDVLEGASAERSVRVVLSGAEQERIVLPVRFEYRVEGSNAVYVKEMTHEIVITSSPLSLSVETLTQVAAGQQLLLAVKVRSNAPAVLERVAVLVQYPFGFTPKPGEGPMFLVGTLAPGEEKTITVAGTLSGEDAENRFFRFTAGTVQADTSPVLAASYTTTETQVTLAKPFLAATLSINRDSGSSPVITVGSTVQGIISWTNTLATPIYDGQVTVKLSGSALDPASVDVSGGYYRSVDNTILFTRDTTGGLAKLDPGDTGGGTFSFRTRSGDALAAARNPAITATISVAGRRVGETNVPESVSSTATKTIKVGTDLTLTSRGLYSTGPFTNSGPWPPTADVETTYTLILVASNTVNSVANAVVTTTLPSYVRFVGATSPADGTLSYNATSRTVTWSLGDVPAGTNARQMAFQVALLPSISQRGTSPVLMYAQTLSGVDRFTQKQLSSTYPEVTTQIQNDPGFQTGNGEVRR